MEETLNISKLMEAAEELTGNGMLNIAETGSIPVQEILIDGKVFTLEVRAKLKPHPEALCQNCNKENVCWYADNGGILCPQCFNRRSAEKGLIVIFHCSESKPAHSERKV